MSSAVLPWGSMLGYQKGYRWVSTQPTLADKAQMGSEVRPALCYVRVLRSMIYIQFPAFRSSQGSLRFERNFAFPRIMNEIDSHESSVNEPKTCFDFE